MKNEYLLPITIVGAGLLIAGAIFFVGKNGAPAATNTGTNANAASLIRPVDSTDHILGNPNAAVKVVEYSDLECPYCQEFQVTMHQVMDFYGKDGQVAWVFRHFPLSQIHQYAAGGAQAAECAANLGGNQTFWNYIDAAYTVTSANGNLDTAKLTDIAKQVGLNESEFTQCMASGSTKAGVDASYADAIKAGAQGTPFIVITTGKDGITLSGAQAYSSMRTAIDEVLKSINKTASSSAGITDTVNAVNKLQQQ